MPTVPAEVISTSLDCLNSPAALVGRDLVVSSCNRLFRSVFPELRGTTFPARICDILDCAHAAEPGGFAADDACGYCMLRRMVELTRISGEQLQGVAHDVPLDSGRTEGLLLSSFSTDQGVLMTVEKRPPATP